MKVPKMNHKVIMSFLLPALIYGWVWPTLDHTITDDYGPRIHPVGNYWQFHAGIDIRAPINTPVYAVNNGTYMWIGGIYGIAQVAHSNNISRYLHCMSGVGTSPRQVEAGEEIAKSGDVGLGTGPHLHFDFGYGGPIHPLKYLPYDYSSVPIVYFLTPLNGQTVSGEVEIKIHVNTTIDRDLNKVWVTVDGYDINHNKVSYDPRINCSQNTVTPLGVGSDDFTFHWDTRTVENGPHTLKAWGEDARWMWGIDSIVVIVENEKPMVIATEPDDGGEDVDIDIEAIKITFNKEMIKSTVESAISIEPNPLFDYTFYWDTDPFYFYGREVYITFSLTDNGIPWLDYHTEYAIIVGQAASDTLYQQMEEDYEFSFRTRQPKFEIGIDPMLAKIEVNQSINLKAVVVSVDVPAEETSDEIVFTIKNRGTPGTKTAVVKVKSYEEEKLNTAVVWAYKPSGNGGSGQQYTEPNPPPSGCDENYSISNHNFPSPWILNSQAKVGIFLSGYAEGMGHLLGKYKIPTAVVLDNFKILGAVERPLSDLDVLIIPTGGLIPYANLQFYRDKFAEFVEQGGTLICFAQSYGVIFEALPGSPDGFYDKLILKWS